MNPKVDAFMARTKQWRPELEKLRQIVLESGLTEELKWGQPCYTYQNKNLIIIHGFKNYCAILFVKGVLISDKAGVMIQQTANVQAARQIRFTNAIEIDQLEGVIKDYINQAIELEKAGAKVAYKLSSEFVYTDEFRQALSEVDGLKTAFEALTPGRQRAYLLYFSAPKLAITRQTRVEKCLDRILDGIGLND